MQVYSGAHLPRRKGVLADGGDLAPFAALALEPQGWPDAPNRAHFPSILLPAGAEFAQKTR
ncbi:MAG: galactose mutarotase, partial [Pseudomonadota bacterium]